ncbi:MAG: hypothetical protein ACXVA9_11310 [Bdellovibrionales bacterium]
MRNSIQSLLVLGLFFCQAVVASTTVVPGCFPPKGPLYCEFWTGSQLLTLPSAFMIYDPATQTVWTRSGSPLTTHPYYNVSAKVGPPPYYNHGYTITIFGDVPVLSVSEKRFDTIPILAYMLDNHEATWGKVPGFNENFNNGLCFEHPWFEENFRGW